MYVSGLIVIIFNVIFPRTLCLDKVDLEMSWYDAQSLCNGYGKFLMPEYSRDVVEDKILPKMKPGEVVWVNAKHALITYTEGSEGLKIGYRPALDTLKYYLCYNGSKKRKCKQSDCSIPLTWTEAQRECQSIDMALYNISTPRQTKSAMPHLMTGVEFWVGKLPNQTIPNMDSTDDSMTESCISLIKDKQENFRYFRTNCSSKYPFFCETAKMGYAPTLKHLINVLDELDNETITQAKETMLPPTQHDVTKETTTRRDDVPQANEQSVLSEHSGGDQTTSGETMSLPAIIGSSFGGIVVILVFIVVLVKIKRRRRTRKDYLNSLQRYNRRRTGSARELITGTIQHPCEGTGAQTLEYEQAVCSSKSNKLDSVVAAASVPYDVVVEKTRSDGIPACRNNPAMYDKMDGPTAHHVKPKVSYINKRAAEQDLTCYESFDPDVQQFEKMTNMRTSNQAENQPNVKKISQSLSTVLQRNESTRSIKKPALPMKPKKVKHHFDLDVKIGQKQIVTTTTCTSNNIVKDLAALDEYENPNLPIYKSPNVTHRAQYLDDLDQYENNDDIKIENQMFNDKKINRLDELDQYENFTYSCTKLKPDSFHHDEDAGRGQSGCDEQYSAGRLYLDDLDQYENYEGPISGTQPDINNLNYLDAYENSCFT